MLLLEHRDEEEDSTEGGLTPVQKDPFFSAGNMARRKQIRNMLRGS